MRYGGLEVDVLFDFYVLNRDVSGTGFAFSPKWDTQKRFFLGGVLTFYFGGAYYVFSVIFLFSSSCYYSWVLFGLLSLLALHFLHCFDYER